jgi:hypothetical protein
MRGLQLDTVTAAGSSLEAWTFVEAGVLHWQQLQDVLTCSKRNSC